MKKLLSLILSVITLITVTVAFSISAHAANYDTIAKARSISLGVAYSGEITRTDETDYYKFTINSAASLSLQFNGSIAAIQLNIFDSNGTEITNDAAQWSSAQILSFNRTIYLTKGQYYFKVNRADYNGNGSREDVEYSSYTFTLKSVSSTVSFEDSHDTIQTAKNVGENTQYFGQISQNDRTDYYKIILNKSAKLNIKMTGTLGVLYVTLYSEEGQELKSIELREDAPLTISDYLSIHLLKGTYYLNFSRGSYHHNYEIRDEECGPYTFTVSSLAANETFEESETGHLNNSISTADSIDLGKSYKGQLAYNDEYDYYKFKVNEGGNYIIKVVSSISANMEYTLYNAEGNELYYNVIEPNSSGSISNKTSYNLKSGYYYIRIKKYEYSYEAGLGNYLFKICSHSKTYFTSKVATLTKNGKLYEKCSICGETISTKTIYKPKTFKLSGYDFTYTGKAIKPAVTLKDASGATISPKNYTVTYKNNTNVGKGEVVIKFKRNYSGSKTIRFNIIPKKTSFTSIVAGKNSITWKWNKVDGVTGYQIRYWEKGNFANAKYTKITNSKTLKRTIKKLKRNKDYYFTIRTYKTITVDGEPKAFFSKWSDTKHIKTK